MTKCDFCEIPVYRQPQCCYNEACRRAAQLFATTLQAQTQNELKRRIRVLIERSIRNDK